jgi:hypothetical protein
LEPAEVEDGFVAVAAVLAGLAAVVPEGGGALQTVVVGTVVTDVTWNPIHLRHHQDDQDAHDHRPRHNRHPDLMATDTTYDLSGCCPGCATVTVACCPNPVPQNLYLNLVFSSGSQCGCLGASLSVPMAWDGVSQWNINYSCGGGVSLTGRMYCSGGTFRLEVALGDPRPARLRVQGVRVQHFGRGVRGLLPVQQGFRDRHAVRHRRQPGVRRPRRLRRLVGQLQPVGERMKPCESVHPGHAGGCRLCWLARHDQRYRDLWGVPGPAEPVPEGSEFRPAGGGLARPARCVSLGVREEFRPGCGGLACRHACDRGLPAVPGGFCQTCPDYEADGDAGWIS